MGAHEFFLRVAPASWLADARSILNTPRTRPAPSGRTLPQRQACCHVGVLEGKESIFFFKVFSYKILILYQT